MARHPPLKSLQAFEATARHLSIKLAAEELCVTPTAISHQIKALEDYLGKKMFLRLTRSLALTSEGTVYAELIHEAFAKIDEAGTAVSDVESGGELVVSTTRSFASNWLGPRLNRFRARHPEVTVRMDGSDQVSDFSRSNVDIAIRFGHGDYPDQSVAWVLDDYVAPVCAPALAPDADSDPETQIGALLAHPLIHYEWSGFSDVDPSWEKWFEMAGHSANAVPISAIHSDEQVCLQEAVDGHGVALISLLAAGNDIEAGRLVAPADVPLKNKSYFAVCPPRHLEMPKVAAFREWLLEEADIFRDGPVGSLLPGTRDG